MPPVCRGSVGILPVCRGSVGLGAGRCWDLCGVQRALPSCSAAALEWVSVGCERNFVFGEPEISTTGVSGGSCKRCNLLNNHRH